MKQPARRGESAPRSPQVPPNAPGTGLQGLLDRTLERIRGGEGRNATARLLAVLDELVPQDADTLRDVALQCRAHPLREVLLQDPFTARACSKPSGCPGDGTTIDYLQFCVAPRGTTRIGRAIFAAITETRIAASVRHTSQLLGRYIDAAAARARHATVLAVGCGHLREAGLSRATCDGELGRFVALDSHASHIERVSASYARFGVEPMLGTAKELLRRGAPGEFDLIYAAGLYNYVTDPTARLLTATLLEAVRPGGSLVIANFLPGHYGRGYMSVFLQWPILRRDQQQLRSLDAAPARREGIASRVFADPMHNIGYLQLRRAPT